MKITQVYYQTSTAVAQFRHKHVGAYATVSKGEDPEKVLRQLARFVHSQLGLPFDEAKKASLRALGDE